MGNEFIRDTPEHKTWSPTMRLKPGKYSRLKERPYGHNTDEEEMDA
jgi:hypothetical protein